MERDCHVYTKVDFFPSACFVWRHACHENDIREAPGCSMCHSHAYQPTLQSTTCFTLSAVAVEQFQQSPLHDSLEELTGKRNTAPVRSAGIGGSLAAVQFVAHV